MALARETKHQAQTKLSVYFRDIRETKKKLALSLTLAFRRFLRHQTSDIRHLKGYRYR